MRTTVLGATGGIGRAITLELARRGHQVTAASRSITSEGLPASVRALPTDLWDPAQARRATADAEVVVMAAQVPYSRWSRELVPLVDAASDAAAAAHARFVMVDNLYAYGTPDTPISDTTPEATRTRKGVLRRDIGRRLLAAHEDGRTRVTIGRFSDYYGPGGTKTVLHQLAVVRALASKAPRAYIAADQPHTFHYLPDAARGFATLVERPEADGRSWILPATAAVTQQELLSHLTRIAGLPDRIGRVTPAMLRLAGLFNAELREAYELIGQFDRPYVVDATDFEQAFGTVELTSHDAALQATLAAARGRVHHPV